MAKYDASIIVLNYFGEKIIKTCIESLFNLNYPKDKYEIIIIDNASCDKSKEIILDLKTEFSNFKTIFLDKNLGFAAGNNIGIKKAEGKYVLLLNNDCTVDKDWLNVLVKLAEKDKSVFAVNSKIYLSNTNKIQNAGIVTFQDGYSRDIGAVVKNHQQDYEIDIHQYDKEREIYAACGAAVLFKKSVLDRIGLLDEDFFMYYEDVDLSERARLHNYKTVYSPKAVVYHQHAASSKELSPFFLYHVEKGRLLHIFFNFPFSVFVREYFGFFFKSWARIFYGLKHRHLFNKQLPYLKVSLFFLINFLRLTKKNHDYRQGIYYSVIKKNYLKITSGYWYFH